MKRIVALTGAVAVIAAGVTLAVPAGLSLAAVTGPATGAAHAALSANGPSLPKITVAMNGKKITVGGALQSGGVQIVSTVTHEAMGEPTFIRLDPGVTVAQLLKAAGGDPNNIALIASIVFSPQANKGTSTAQAHLSPGQYVAVDLATNAKTPPLTTFTIAKAASAARLPKPQATISSIEFGFRGPGKLHDGELVRFANHGFLVHMIVAARGRNAAGARKIARLLKAGKDGKAQRLATGFYSFFNIMTHGGYQQQVISNRPGHWVLACFMDTQDGREHTQLGMERVIRIVK
jgi:hypothetical protein